LEEVTYLKSFFKTLELCSNEIYPLTYNSEECIVNIFFFNYRGTENLTKILSLVSMTVYRGTENLTKILSLVSMTVYCGTENLTKILSLVPLTV